MATEEAQQSGRGTVEAPTHAQQLHGGQLSSDDTTKEDSSTKDKEAKELEKQQEKPSVDQQVQAKEEHDREAHDERNEKTSKDTKKDEKQPAGGYDSIPVPKRPRGWTVRVTVHRATNLPMADVNTLSSDPYVITQLYTDTPDRHKEDPPLRLRTPTVRRSTDPEWNWPWTIANIPSSGFKLKLRVYDEDPSNHDDRLGNVLIKVDSVGEGFADVKEHAYKINKRSGSKRAYLIRAVTKCFGATEHMHGELIVSIELLGRTPEDGQDGRVYTVGPCWWTKHFSPMLGRIANTRGDHGDGNDSAQANGEKKNEKQTQRYNFQSNQIQFAGPVPKELYHRFVEFKPWVQRMFTASGILGWLASKALHSQHDRVYHFDRNTKWGVLPEDAGEEMTKLFLEHVHYDQGARIFTYVITLDGLWRFTETGKEFGIDMLSKHTMHSDVGVYIAFSGEFFIHRLKKPKEPPPPEPVEESSQSHPPSHEQNKAHPPDDLEAGPPHEEGPKGPNYYELIIDNDSGTYRPNADLLPLLKKFLALHLPGLHILTLDCQKDAEKMNKMKEEQRERKKAEGDGVVYLQGDDSSSISSSDEDDLDALVSGLGGQGPSHGHHGTIRTAAKDFKLKEESKLHKVKREYAGKKRVQGTEADAAGKSATGEVTAQSQATPGATKTDT